MWSFFVASLPLIVLTIILGLLYLPSRSTHLGVRIDVALAWFAALLTVVLTPTDVATALLGTSPSALSEWWQAAYWYGFIAQVCLLPIHMQMTRSGEFTLIGRLLASLKYNLMYYIVLLGIAVIGLVILLFSGRLQPSNILGFCIAFSNAYGLIGAIFLMGFGLVAIPKQLWRSADTSVERRRLCHVAGVQAERTRDSHRILSIAVLLARKTDIMFPRHDATRPWMDVVLELADSTGPDFRPSIEELPDDEEAEDFFDREDLARLRGRLKSAIKDQEREKALYEEAVHQYLQWEQIHGLMEAGRPGPGSNLTEQAQWLWHYKLKFYVFRGSAIIAAAASLAIALAEGTIAGMLPNLSLASRALHAAAASKSQFTTEALCFVLLAYPCAAAYYAIYKLGIFAFYRMVPHHTDAYSLCYSGLIMCRFAAPLAFNFMAAVALPTGSGHYSVDVTNTRFYESFGQLMMRQPIIGLQFTTFAPALLIPYMLLLSSGLFDRLVGLFFRKSSANLQFEDDWETTTNYAATGRRLLRMESENIKKGLPIGLALETPFGISGPTLDHGNSGHHPNNSSYHQPEGGFRYNQTSFQEEINTNNDNNPWWKRIFGNKGHEQLPSSNRSNFVRSADAEAARGRLAQALGRSSNVTNVSSGIGGVVDSVPLLGGGSSIGSGGGSDVFARLDAEPGAEWWGYRKKYGGAPPG